ncbi:hypothetical protein CHARACLAT_011555 [Characodon lateralis]|uniref:Uncharacterized protein n=1 Tax=Characodon lateralis TaxID=208331 RepID=A0ABU7E8W8_9TELE|nr:hypothetical protein [Characodon lateralis]
MLHCWCFLTDYFLLQIFKNDSQPEVKVGAFIINGGKKVLMDQNPGMYGPGSVLFREETILVAQYLFCEDEVKLSKQTSIHAFMGVLQPVPVRVRAGSTLDQGRVCPD